MEPQLRILVIDDDDVDRMAIRRALKSAGLNAGIEEATGGEDAMQALAGGAFDCVFLDYLLPGEDGLGVLRRIRAAGNAVPIIMLTGHGDAQIAVELLQAGASDYVPKARLSPEVLARSVRNVIRVYRAELERRQAEEELRKSKETIADILESISDAFFAVDDQGRFTYVNQQAETLLGEPREVLLGKTVWASLPDSAYWLRDSLRNAIANGLAARVEGVFNPTGLWLESHIYPRQDGLSVYFRDITERKYAEERLNFLANHDVLTGLPNRSLLMDRLGQAMTRAPWHDRIVGVLFCDLDRFKVVNDTLGHPVGDQLLQLVADRLNKCARDGDTIARLGGDEFVIVLSDVARIEDVGVLAQKVQQLLLQPYFIEDQELVVSVSIGISLFPLHGHDAGALLRNADIAMYRAKEKGRNGVELYEPVMNAHAARRFTLEKDLRHAVQRNELRLHYQPLLDLHSGVIVGAEALLRWEHGEFGLLGPGEFLSIAEESGLIVEIGEWVLHTACARNRAWQTLGLPPITMAVNLSNRQFKQARLLDSIRDALGATGLDPGHLELELTEDIVLKDTAGAIETLHELRAMGVRLSIDDFGTGYSSLAYLKRCPLNAVKIDRSFVRDITLDADDAAITGAIIAMAHKMGMETVAEGVETPEQMAFLREQGCDRFQGYFVSPPVPAEAFSHFFWSWQDRSQSRLLIAK